MSQVLEVCAMLVLWRVFMEVEGQSGNTCEYRTFCSRESTNISPTCGAFEECKDRTESVPCIISQHCTNVFHPWGECTVTCGGGTRLRTGRCCASRCTKVVNESETCNSQPCPAAPSPSPTPPPTTPETIHGMWSPWTVWAYSPCSASCCGGTQSRTRMKTCTSPPPSGNGMDCEGNGTETQSGIICNTHECPLSCVNMPVGTIYNDPCVKCSNIFYGCSGDNEPIAFTCPVDRVWSPLKYRCELECDP